jgi:hypothetical protein
MRTVRMRDRSVDCKSPLQGLMPPSGPLLLAGSAAIGVAVPDPEPGPNLSLGDCWHCGETDVVEHTYEVCKKCRKPTMTWT